MTKTSDSLHSHLLFEDSRLFFRSTSIRIVVYRMMRDMNRHSAHVEALMTGHMKPNVSNIMVARHFSLADRSTMVGKRAALPDMRFEPVVAASMPAVVTIRANAGTGTGFFITETGVIVTNQHVVNGSSSVQIIRNQGDPITSTAIYQSHNRDLALIKVDMIGYPFLRLANPASIAPGADVVAIGSPGVGSGSVLAGTVTKGIISAVRNTKSDGVLVHTDAAINPGNSGGPLLNLRGEVVEINTLKIVTPGVTGLDFAIMSNEVLDLLKKQFDYLPPYLTSPAPSTLLAQTADQGPGAPVTATPTAARMSASAQASEAGPQRPSEKVQVEITSEPSGADIFVDDIFVGSTPSKVPIAPGDHTVRVGRTSFKDWSRKLHVEPGSTLSLHAVLELPKQSDQDR